MVTNVIERVREDSGVGGLAPRLHYILEVRKKLADGRYPVEETKCLCGGDNDKPLSKRDRYGIEYQLVICLDCGLMRANPRMTKEAYDEFYKKDYRDIYCIRDSKTPSRKDLNLEHALAKTGSMLSENVDLVLFMCDHYDLKTDVVFDIGCNTGGYLAEFRDKRGSQIYGVDYDPESVAFGKKQGIPIWVGGAEALLGLNKKADFIILNHVIEHFLDISKEMETIQKLLKDTGHLYIGCPGLYTVPFNKILQNAHTYQFTLNTLEKIMADLGWTMIHGTDMISAFFKYVGTERTRKVNNKWETREIIKWLDNPNMIPKLKSFNKFGVKMRRKNIKAALSHKLPDIGELVDKHSDKKNGIVIAGGPSVEGYINKINELAKDGIIIVIEKMQKWCLKNGIKPDYVVVLDACPDVAITLEKTYDDIEYIISTQCQPDVFKQLEKRSRNTHIIISPLGDDNFVNILKENGYKDSIALVNTGGSVALACMSIAGLLGLKNIKMFGFDCHTMKGDYIKGIDGVGLLKPTRVKIQIDDRVFDTLPNYLAFLQQFFTMYSIGVTGKNKCWDSIKIYGDSMVKYAAKNIDIDGDKA